MLFSNKVAMDKTQQKLYKRSRQLIEDTINGNTSIVQEQADLNLENSTFNIPIGRKASRRRLFNRRGRLQESVTHKLFKENIYDLFNRSLLLDESFKFEKDANLYMLFEDVFDNMLNEGYFSWDSIKNNECAFTRKLYALCEEVAKDSADNAVNMDTAKKMNVPEESLISEDDDEDDDKKSDKKKKKSKADKEADEVVTEKDKKKIDDETESDKEAVSDAVKEKVVDTIKDEKERSEKEEEDKEQVKEMSKTDKELEEDEEKAAKEEAEAEEAEDDSEDTDDEDDDSSDDDDNDDDEDKDDDDSSDETAASSEESEENKKSDEKSDKKEGEEDDKAEKSESYSFSKKILHPNKFRNTSLFRSIQENVTNKFLREKKNGLISENVVMNMDMIFAESLAYYTLLETFNTIRITNIQPSEAKKLCKTLLLQ